MNLCDVCMWRAACDFVFGALHARSTEIKHVPHLRKMVFFNLPSLLSGFNFLES